MADPALALQGAIVAALKADAAVSALVGGRVYDAVKDGAEFPYIVVGETQSLGDDTESCGDGSEVFHRSHVWSRDVGFPEAKRIMAEVRRVLKAVTLVSPFTVVVAEYVSGQALNDPDGLTRHGVVDHRYLITHSN